MILARGNLIIICSATATNHNPVLSGPSPHVSKPKIKIREIIFRFPIGVTMSKWSYIHIPAPPSLTEPAHGVPSDTENPPLEHFR
jgi:hypothetical protein